MVNRHKFPQVSNVLLWGAKGKARIIEAMLMESSLGRPTLMFDGSLQAPPFETLATFINDIKKLKSHLEEVSHFVVCIGAEHGYARFQTAKYLEKVGLKPLSIIHPRGFIDPSANLGVGCQVMPCAVVHKFTEIGDYSIINTGSVIDHECQIGNGVHIMGSVAIAGMVKIADFATIGTNATILPFIEIGEGAIIGAGSVVTKNVPPYSVVMGVPATYSRMQTPYFNEGELKELLR